MAQQAAHILFGIGHARSRLLLDGLLWMMYTGVG